MLASLAAAIALGATSMSDIALLAHLAPVLGAAPSGPTVRRTLDLAGTRMLDRIARARAKARAHAWNLIEATPAGFPWLAVAGKTLTGLAGHRHGRHPGNPPAQDKEGAAPTWKMGYGFHPPTAPVREHPRVPAHVPSSSHTFSASTGVPRTGAMTRITTVVTEWIDRQLSTASR